MIIVWGKFTKLSERKVTFLAVIERLYAQTIAFLDLP